MQKDPLDSHVVFTSSPALQGGGNASCGVLANSFQHYFPVGLELPGCELQCLPVLGDGLQEKQQGSLEMGSWRGSTQRDQQIALYLKILEYLQGCSRSE